MTEFAAWLANALGGGSVLVALGAVARFLWIAWRNREEHQVKREQAEAQSVDAAFSRLISASERQDAEIARLSSRDGENRERIEKLEKSNETLAQENRSFRDLIRALVTALQRKPPEDAESLLEFIFRHAPGFGPHNKE